MDSDAEWESSFFPLINGAFTRRWFTLSEFALCGFTTRDSYRGIRSVHHPSPLSSTNAFTLIEFTLCFTLWVYTKAFFFGNTKRHREKRE